LPTFGERGKREQGRPQEVWGGVPQSALGNGGGCTSGKEGGLKGGKENEGKEKNGPGQIPEEKRQLGGWVHGQCDPETGGGESRGETKKVPYLSGWSPLVGALEERMNEIQMEGTSRDKNPSEEWWGKQRDINS